MNISLGCDHGGYELKEKLKKCLIEWGHTVQDFGTHSTQAVDYPQYAQMVAQAVTSGECERGIIICGTGVGASMAANKVKGARAALCVNEAMARLTREHNDANILALGARIIGDVLAQELVRVFLTTPFSGEQRHINRIEGIARIEQSS